LRKPFIYIISLFLIVCFMNSSALADEQNTARFTLNEVITKVLENSKDVKKAKLAIDKAEEQRDNNADLVSYVPTTGSNSPEEEHTWYNLLSSDMTWELSKKSYAAEEDKQVLNACKMYWDVQNALEKLNAKKLGLSYSKLYLQRVQAMNRLGMIPSDVSQGTSPQQAITDAERLVEKAESDLTASENEVNSAYDALNQAIGFSVEERPLLIDEIKFEPLEIDNLEVEVQRAIELNPNIWQLDESVKLAKYSYDMLYASGIYTPYKIRQINKNEAELNSATAKDAARLATRALYYAVINLEDGYNAADKSVTGAAESLRVSQLLYDLGMITREQLLNKESLLAEAKLARLNIVAEHSYMKLAFQKPWAVSAN